MCNLFFDSEHEEEVPVGRLTYTYALVTALYDENQDFLDAFLPFVVQALPNTGHIRRDGLSARLRQEFGLSVPSHVLRLLLYRGQQAGYVEKRRRAKTFQLTESGIAYKSELETPREVERRINELTAAGVSFFAERGIAVDDAAFSDLMTNFVQSNLEHLMEFMGSVAECGVDYKATGEEERVLVEFITGCEISEPARFDTLLDVVRGSILSSVFCGDKSQELEALQEADFSSITVFLDTNFLLAVLGFESDELVAAADELMALLNMSNCVVRVFPFTVDETSAFLAAYASHEHEYFADVAVRSAYSAMRTSGLRKSDVRQALDELERRISSQGIEIASSPLVPLEELVAKDPNVMKAVRKYKTASTKTLAHDIAAIETIRDLRQGKRFRRLQESEFLFLSSDVGLSRASFEGLGHKRRGTVAEVIHDGILASVLWLRSPNGNPPLKSIVAAHSRNLFVDRRVWHRFLEVMQELREREEIQDEDLANLLYRDYIANVLIDIDARNVDKVSKQLILEEAMRAREAREQERASDIEALRAEHNEELRVVGQGVEAAWTAKVERELADVEEAKNRMAGIVSCVLSSVCTVAYVAVVVILFCLVLRTPLEPWVNAVALTAAFTAPSSLLFGLWKHVRPWLHRRLGQWLYSKSHERMRLEALLENRREASPQLLSP